MLAMIIFIIPPKDTSTLKASLGFITHSELQIFPYVVTIFIHLFHNHIVMYITKRPLSMSLSILASVIQ